MAHEPPRAVGSEMQIRAVIGLGNPGKQYASTRHNVGFVVIERLAARLGAQWSSKFNSNFAKARIAKPGADLDLLLLQPLGYMNLSGHAVQPMAAFFAMPPQSLLVVHDDLDLPFGRIQVKMGGGHGGHNGLRSIAAQLATTDFARVRVGIGRPGADPSGEGSLKGGADAVSDWVLSPFGASERAELPDLVDRAVRAIEDVVCLGVRTAMNTHNGAAVKAKP